MLASVFEDCSGDDFLQGFRYAVATSNMFFRTLRSCGVFIKDPEKSTVYHVGQEMCASWPLVCHTIIWQVLALMLWIMEINYIVLVDYRGVPQVWFYSLWVDEINWFNLGSICAHGLQMFHERVEAVSPTSKASLPATLDTSDGATVFPIRFLGPELLSWYTRVFCLEHHASPTCTFYWDLLRKINCLSSPNHLRFLMLGRRRLYWQGIKDK